METREAYKTRTFDLSGLKGISDKTLEMHFKLYDGLREADERPEREDRRHPEGRQDRSGGDAGLLRAHAPPRLRVQRHGAARVLLREPEGAAAIREPGAGRRASARRCEASFGSYETWKTDFVGVGKMRGVGWAICYQDPATRRLSNHWITLHEVGNVAGFVPILVMDVWEHAFLLDYAPAEPAEVHRRVLRQRRLGGHRPTPRRGRLVALPPADPHFVSVPSRTGRPDTAA